MAENRELATCSVCKDEKPRDAFNLSLTTTKGISNRCRECGKAYMLIWHAKNKDKSSESVKRIVDEILLSGKKACIDCEQEKAIHEFPGNAWSKDGHGKRCLPCKRSRMVGDISAVLCTKCKGVKPASGFYKLKAKANGLRSECKGCTDSRKAEWYQKSVPLRRAIEKKYRIKNRDRILEWAKRYHHEHAHERSIYMQLFRKKNPDYWSKWLQRNHLRARLQSQKRRAFIKEAPGSFTMDDVADLIQSQKGLCAYCAKTLNEAFEIDHIIPISRGGSNFPGNLACARKTCNRLKSNRLDWSPVLDCFKVQVSNV